MAYISLIRETKWTDLSDEHQDLRVTVENDLYSACYDGGTFTPIMLQGAFGIGKTTALNYFFHYAWEILKTPAFYISLEKLVDAVKERAEVLESGKVRNSQLKDVIWDMLNSQLDKLKSDNWNVVTDVFFPEFNSNENLADYLSGFEPVSLETNSTSTESGDIFTNIVFSESVIKEALVRTGRPLLLIDEFESKFYELKKYVESSGGGILRELFDQIVQDNEMFMLIIGNGPASGYEVAKDKGADINDSDTAEIRRLKTIPIPFPTAKLLKRKFMKDQPNGFVNFIWWMSRCRPGHIQKLVGRIKYALFEQYDFSEFINNEIFKLNIDESGEEVKYLKVSFFDTIDSHLHRIVNKLLLDFEPRKIDDFVPFQNALDRCSKDFYVSDQLISLDNELLPEITNDVSEFLKSCSEDGKYISVSYVEHIGKYITPILYACADKNGNIAFGSSSRENYYTFIKSFVIPLFELVYDFISQYEDNDEPVIRQAKDFVLECISNAEKSLKNNNEYFLDGTSRLFQSLRFKRDSSIYLQFSLQAVREFIEQPIGSPQLTYKGKSLEKQLESCDLSNASLLTAHKTYSDLLFVPVLEQEALDKYLIRLRDYLDEKLPQIHEKGESTLHVVYLQKNEKMQEFINEYLYNSDNNLLPLPKLKKLVFDDFNDFDFKFGAHISDFIDSLAKIAIIGSLCDESKPFGENNEIDINTVINIIKEGDWTKQKEVKRTIEHYAKLVKEGDHGVLNRINKCAEECYDEAISKQICKKSDYKDNVEWDFNSLCDFGISDETSRYIGLYYIFENAQNKEVPDESLCSVLKTVSSSMHLSAKEDPVQYSIQYGQVYNILSHENAKGFLTGFNAESDFLTNLQLFIKLMVIEETPSNIEELLYFIHDDLPEHWIGDYNKLMKYNFPAGDVLMKLAYLKEYIGDFDLQTIHSNLAADIATKNKRLTDLRNKLSIVISDVTNLLYDESYAKAHARNMPFANYLPKLSEIKKLLDLCNMSIMKEPECISSHIIIFSVVSRIEDMLSSVSTVCSQITSIKNAIQAKMAEIDNSYQIPINEYLENEYVDNMISHIDWGKVLPNDKGCLRKYARALTADDDFSAVMDRDLKPAQEEEIDDKDITTVNNVLSTKRANLTIWFDKALNMCKEYNAYVDEYNQVHGYITNLLKFDDNE